ncbi:hypothetical protein X943_002275 [Babesia divergens]|uniref:Uncharacterized protein n=1 Tax=Babesia divergens TaxID=32595 RepID=A0AAD9LKI5_BABDI|nr:hypothetical protein X943_002275 [Babesia divergens]
MVHMSDDLSSGESETYVHKYVGNSTLGRWNKLLPHADDNLYFHYDIDLYNYETVEILCPFSKNGDTYLDPIEERMFYTTGFIHDDAVAAKHFPRYRFKSKISAVIDTIRIKGPGSNGEWSISFIGEAKHKQIETMYFDCISLVDGIKTYTATVQINVMPHYEAIKKMERIVIDAHPWLTPSMNLMYYKYPRHGTILNVICKSSERLIKGSKQHIVDKEQVNDGSVIPHDIHSYIFQFNNLTPGALKTSSPHSYCDDVTKNTFALIQQDRTDVITFDWMDSLSDDMAKDYKDKKMFSHPFIIFCNDYSATAIIPIDCPRHVALQNDHIVPIHTLMGNLNYTRYSKSYSALDSSQYYSHRKHSTYCKHEDTAKYIDSPIGFEFPAVCDFNNAFSLDSNGITCSIFVSPQDHVIVRGYTYEEMQPALSDEKSTGRILRKVKNSDGGCEDCFFTSIEDESDANLIVEESKEKKFEETIINFKYSEITYNPRYFAWYDEDVEENETSRPKRVMAVHLSHSVVIPQLDGSLKIQDGKVDSSKPNGCRYFSIPMQGIWKLHLKCSDFFDNSRAGDKIKLYPEGKNTFFPSVESGKVDPKELEVKEFQREFASHGISIYKAPETLHNNDLQLVYDEGKGVWAERKSPAYFICAQENWAAESGSYAVIALDPGYNLDRLYGCGTRPAMFLNNENKVNSDTSCDFTLDNKRTIGFFCPSPIPDHFLKGDQQKWAPATDGSSATTNPYKNMLRCYDRSTAFQRFSKSMVDLKLFDAPQEVGEVRSLWIFRRHHFIRKGQSPILRVMCQCFEMDGQVTATIHLSSGFRRYGTTHSAAPA